MLSQPSPMDTGLIECCARHILGAGVCQQLGHEQKLRGRSKQAMGVRERQVRDKELFRSRILDAARELIREHGYEKLTIRKIADRIEYSPMSLYNHFADKDDILVALAREGFAKIGKALPKPGSGEPLAVLRKAMLQYVDFGLKHPDEYELVFMTRRSLEKSASSKISNEANIPDDAGGQNAFRRMLEYVDAAIAAGLVSGQRFELAKVLWAGIHGCVSLQITQLRFPFGPPKVFAEAVVDTLIAGIRV